MDDKNKYNNALEKLQDALAPKDGREISGLTRSCIEEIFPELKESEDERIRKELIEHIKANKWADYVLFQKFSPDDVIAWLEKQGEKPQGKTALEAIKEEQVDNANKIEQNPAWSEEDDYIDGYEDGRYEGYKDAIEKACKWLYKRQAVDLEVNDIEKFVGDFKKAMEK